MTAMAGATAGRTWLQAYRGTWLTPRRLRAATVGLFAAATIVASVGVSGSSAPAHHSPATTPTAAQTH